jgi:RHS repeat-associated protein
MSSKQKTLGCCGDPPPDPCGGECCSSGGGTPSGPGGLSWGGREGCSGGTCSYGAPGYMFGLSSANLIIMDTPMWYPSLKGPEISIHLVHNRINTQNMVTNAAANYYCFGKKWSFNFSNFIKQTPDGNARVVIPGGQQLDFINMGGGVYTAASPRIHHTLVRTDAYYRLVMDGSKLTYLFPTNLAAIAGDQIARIEDQYGNTVRFEYDALARLTNIIDAAGRYFSLRYNADGLVTNVMDKLGRFSSFRYSADGDLVAMGDMGGYETTLVYDNNHWITNIVYPNESERVFNYQTAPGLGSPYDDSFDYYGDSFRIRVGDSLGYTNEYFYHAFSYMGPITVKDKGDNVWVYAHDDREPSPYVYLDGVNARYDDYRISYDSWAYRKYDLSGNLTAMQVATGRISSSVGFLDVLGSELQDYVQEYTYDAGFRVLTETNKVSGVVIARWSNQYDSAGNLLSRTDPQSNTTAFAYDSFNNLVAVTNALGDATRFMYDAYGNMTGMVDACQNVTKWLYDTNGLLTHAITPDYQTNTMTYDEIGRLATVQDSAGLLVINVYDGLDRISSKRYPDGTSMDYNYACCGLDSIIDRLGHGTYYTRDILGRITSVNNSAGPVVNFGYNAQDQITNMTVVVGGQMNTTIFGYISTNGYTRLARRVSPMGKTNSCAYTYRGRLARQTDGEGRAIDYGYDVLGRLINVSYGVSTNIGFSNDVRGLLTRISGLSSTNTYDYDALGRLTNTVNIYSLAGFSNVAYGIRYQYDSVGNVTNRALLGLTGFTNVLRTVYTYDSMRRIASVSNESANASYTYLNGRAECKAYGNGDVTRYGYDVESRPFSITTSNGTSTVQGWSYQYNAMGMITNIADLAGNRWDYEYDSMDQLLRETYNWTNSAAWEYSETGNRLSQSGCLGARSYSYDADNELMWISQSTSAVLTVSGQVEPGPASNKWFDTWAMAKGISRPVSNDGSFSIPDVPVLEGSNNVKVLVRDISGNIASQNVYFTKLSVPRTDSFGYDRNGCMTNHVGGTSTNTMFYDVEKRLVRAESNGVPILECWYDSIGRRIAKKEIVNGQTNHYQYVYDGWIILGVLNQHGQLIEYYTRGSGIAGDIGTLVAETKFTNGVPANTYYYHCNHRGDVTVVRQGTNTVAGYDYAPFGELRASTGSYNSRFKYSSKEYDLSTGLYNFGYRMYSPMLSRWCSRDALWENGGLNLYAYVGNAPLDNVDIDGLLSFHWHGNWGGPGWVNGGWGSEDGPIPLPGDPNYKKPVDEEDACYEGHDRCLNACPKCPDKAKSDCAEKCDHTLAECLGKLKNKTPRTRITEWSFRTWIPWFVH